MSPRAVSRRSSAVLLLAALAWMGGAPPAGGGTPAGNGGRETGGAFAPGVLDGGFEAGSPSPVWTEESISFPTPLCTLEACGDGLGTAGPHRGEWWAWLGGFPGADRSSLTQSVHLPDGGLVVLELWLWHGAASGNGADVLRIYLEDELLFELRDGDSEPTDGYRRLLVPLSSRTSRESHPLRIECETFGPGVSNFAVDDVALRPFTTVDVPTLGAAPLALLALLLATLALRRLRRSPSSGDRGS